MEYLVRIETSLPNDLSDSDRDDLLAAEVTRGKELMESGALRRIWRIPGRFANWSLYEAVDATELHDLLTSLPLSRWQIAEVQPLATHPLEAHS